jgi:hypothetical protein
MNAITKAGLAAAGVVMTLATASSADPVRVCPFGLGGEEVVVGEVTVCNPVDPGTLPTYGGVPTYGGGFPTYGGGFPTYGFPTHG